MSPVSLLPMSSVHTTWLSLYPEKTDPKNLYYRAWRLGFPTLSVDDAYQAMIGDTNTLEIVKGKTLRQLQARFGNIRKDGELLPYQRDCLNRIEYLKGKNIAFLGDSYWLVVFEGDRVADLILGSKG